MSICTYKDSGKVLHTLTAGCKACRYCQQCYGGHHYKHVAVAVQPAAAGVAARTGRAVHITAGSADSNDCAATHSHCTYQPFCQLPHLWRLTQLWQSLASLVGAVQVGLALDQELQQLLMACTHRQVSFAFKGACTDGCQWHTARAAHGRTRRTAACRRHSADTLHPSLEATGRVLTSCRCKESCAHALPVLAVHFGPCTQHAVNSL